MAYSPVTCPVRQAIDNQLNRDLIAQAREQGFIFSDPFADAAIWQGLQAADLEGTTPFYGIDTTDWLFVKAFEATLFFIYQQAKR